MDISEHDEGIFEAIVERLEKQRLPRLLEMQECVNSGETLNDFDIEYLKSAIEDARRIKPLLDKYPEFHELEMKLISIYKDISEKDLLLEKNK